MADLLKLRAATARQVRRFFDDAGFLEVQPPCLSHDTVVDAFIDPIAVPAENLRLPEQRENLRLPEQCGCLYLQSSPEFAMKRLLAAGSGSIYSLGPVFRAGERSPRHNVEFTMLEWYDVGAGIDAVIGQTVELVRRILNIDPPQIVTYRDLFVEMLGFDPIDSPLATLHDATRTVDAELADSLAEDRDGMLDVLLTERIEPRISDRAIVIRNYPLSQAALARVSDADPATAERFELMINGIELANGYGELLDADELLRRNRKNNIKRVRSGRDPLPVDSRLIEAMRQGLPPCAGAALGFDRLVMPAAGTDDIADVLPLPIERA